MRGKMFLSALVLVTMLLAACAAPTPQIIEKEKVVEKPVVQTVVVEKPVVETVVVEKEVVVTPTPLPAGLPKGILSIGVTTDIDTLDPVMANNVSVQNVGMTAYEGLTYLNEKGEVEPLLADTWEILDPTTYVFHLHKGVKFHNGEPFNADAVIFTWKRVMEPGRGSKYGWDTVEDIQKIDDYTVKIITKAPDPIFLKRMGSDAGGIYPPKYATEAGDQGVTQAPVGTGPFKFKEWVRGEKVVYVANPDYWGGPGVACVEAVIWKGIPEASSRVAALETGEIDIALLVPPAQIGILMDNPNLKVSRALGTRTFYVMFDNVSTGRGTPLEDKRVRQALIYAVDRQAILDAVFMGQGEVVNSLIGNVQFGHDPSLPPLPYDPEKAKQLLTEAGYPDGFEISMGCSSGGYPNDVEVCQAIVGYLEEVIDVTLNVYEANLYWDLAAKHEMDPMFFEGTGDRFLDPIMPVGIVMKKESIWTTWDSPEIQKMLDEGESTVDPAERKEIYFEMQRLMQEDPPCIALWQVYNFTGISTRVSGFVPRPNESVIVRGVRVRD